MLSGGCLCERIRYEVRGTPFNATLCHCRACRLAAGAPVVAWFSCRPGELVFGGVEPRRFVSSPGVARGFCEVCGTTLTYARADLPDEIDVATASLDRPEDVPPTDATQHDGRVAWIDTIAELPAFPASRTVP